MNKSTLELDEIEVLGEKLRDIVAKLNNGVYGARLDVNTDNEIVLDFQNSFNQILELIDLNIDVALIGDDSIISEFVEVFSSFANRRFDKSLFVSEKGTILDAIAAGVNMLGQELEFSTVSKNELEIERNRLNEAQEIAKMADWEYYFDNSKFVFSNSFNTIYEFNEEDNIDEFQQLENSVLSRLPNLSDEIVENLKTDSFWKFENKIVTKSGATKYLLNIVTELLNDNNELIGYKGILQDISELKENQKRLKYKTELEKLISDISTSLLKKTSNFEKTISKDLESVAEFFGAERAYFIKFDCQEVEQFEVYEFNNEKVSYTTKSIFAENPMLFKMCLNTAMGDEAIQSTVDDLMVEAYPEEKNAMKNNNVKSFICIPTFSDNSDYGIFGLDSVVDKKLWSEEEISGLKILANIFSDAIYRNSFEKELITARNKAEESDRLKSAFLANMSHEIRTPMNGILGFAELLKLPDLSGEQQSEFIAIIEESGRRMLNTIDDIVKISKIDSNQISLNLADVNVAEMLKYVYNLFSLKASIAKIDFKYYLPETLTDFIFVSDKEKVYGVLSNLVNNAIKFTEEGLVEFGVNREQDKLVFFVRDTGIGISDDMIDKVFERFVQADMRLNRAHEGSGLGLAISKAYLDFLGGEIWCESKPDFGSSFYFTVPVEIESSRNNKKVVAKNIIDPLDIELSLKVLIVDDHHFSQTYLSYLLQEYCRECICVSSGDEAIDMCRKHGDIDLVLMDIKMPGTDGCEATKQIKSFCEDVFIVAQTAFSLEDEVAKYKDVFDAYVTKPINKTELMKIIIDRFC